MSPFLLATTNGTYFPAQGVTLSQHLMSSGSSNPTGVVQILPDTEPGILIKYEKEQTENSGVAVLSHLFSLPLSEQYDPGVPR